MTHISIDIETLGLRPGSVIPTIAAVAFEENTDLLKLKKEEIFFARVPLDQHGMGIDASTVKWWMGQGEEARWDTFLAEPTHSSLVEALVDLCDWLGGFPDALVWGHGSVFDIGHLEEAYRRYHINVPWSYKNVRDTRTLFAQVPGPLLAQIDREGVVHRALDDAIYQGRCIRLALEHLKWASPRR